jgi:hypothetical protein
MFPMKRVDIYLNDHLAGSMLGCELSRRALAENRGTSFGEFLERLHGEIVADRRTLKAVMTRLDVDHSPLKPAAAWALEKVGRLKLNGRVRGYSPLSRLLELEALEAGVAGKRSLWEVLAVAFDDDERLKQFDFAALVARADGQLSEIGEHRRAAAREAFEERAASVASTSARSPAR